MKSYKSVCLTSFIFLHIAAFNIHAAEDLIPVARFNQIKNLAASGWQVKEWKGKADISLVNSSDTGQVLLLKSKGTSTGVYKDIELDIKKAPYLNWQWKVTKLPERGDVRSSSTDDQAAQIYVIFPKFPSQVNSRILGYIWDTNAPKDSMLTSTKFSKSKDVRISSGQKGLGNWLSEKRNVYEDYKNLFKEEPPKVGRVSVMIDSDDTRSSAESYFGDIFFSKK